MQFLAGLIHNPVFLSAGGAWLVAQVSKMIYETARYGFSVKRLTGGGGMPSSHSATVTGLAVGCLLSEGADSASFAIAAILAMVVIYDAMGVRLTAGKEARILNRMRERDLKNGQEPLSDEKLDEKTGHTLPECLAGIAIGIVMGIVMCLVVAPALAGITF